MESWVAAQGFVGVLAFVALFVVATSLLFPESALSIAGGALFGFELGAAAVVVGSLLAAALQHALATHILRDRVQRVLGAKPSLAAIQRAVAKGDLRLQVLLRLAPLNQATLSYLLGATGVRFRGFLIAGLALIPQLLVEVYFGHAGKHVARMAGRTKRQAEVHDLLVLGGLVVCLAVLIVVSRMARKAIQDAVVVALPLPVQE